MNTDEQNCYVEIMKAVNPRDKAGNVLLPSAEQASVIVSDKTVISVIAGAGSGKTRTMTNRIAYCLGIGQVQPSEVLGLTFTNKAAGELDDRVNQCLWRMQAKGFLSSVHDDNDDDSAMSVLLERPTISTYNSFASDIVSRYGMLVSCDTGTRLITDGERYQLMSKVVDSMSLDDIRSFDARRSSVIKNALSLSASLLDHGTDIDSAREFFETSNSVIKDIAGMSADRIGKELGWPSGLSKYWNKLKKDAPIRLQEGLATLTLIEKYWKLKKEQGVIEFADQVDMAVRILRKHAWVREELSSRYRLVLLDEYQDTSVQQATMLHLALGERNDDQWYSICAVGDPNQAIYGFRGASANAFSHFAQVFADQSVHTFSLSTTYRNGTAILQAANAVAQEITTVGVDVEPLQPSLTAQDGRVVRIHPLRRDDSYRAIAAYIRNKIDEVHGAEEAKKADNPNYTIRGAEIAVLCRKRRYFSDVVNALEELNIPYEIVGGTAILERPEIITLRSALIGATYPYRHDVFTRLFAYLNIGVSDLRVLSSALRGEEKNAKKNNVAIAPTLSDILDNLDASTMSDLSAEARRRLTYLAQVLRQIRERSNLPLADIVHGAMQDLGLELAAVSRVDDAQYVQNSLDSLVRMASQYQVAHPQCCLSDFLEWLDYVEAYEQAGEEEAGDDAPIVLGDVEVNPGVVQIMTIHSSKGLEWKDLVVIPEMVEGEFSDITSRPDVWMTQKGVVPYPLRSDRKYLPVFTFRYPQLDDYPLSSDGEKNVPTIANSPNYPLACALENFEEAELEYESQEARRLAYVAFTRAADELVLAGYTTKNSDLVERRGGSGKNKDERIISLIAPSRFVRDIEKKNVNNEIMVDSADVLYPQSMPGSEQNGNTALWAMCAVEETVKEKIDDVIDANSEIYEKYRRIFSATDWDLLTQADTKEEREEGGNPSEKIDADPQCSYPLGLNRSLGTIDAYDEDSAQRVLDRLKEEADLLVKELAEQGQNHTSSRTYLTASDIVRIAGDSQAFLDDNRRPVPHKPSRKARIGTQVHQRIADSYLVAPVIDLDMPDEATPYKDTIEAFFSAFQNSSWVRFPQIRVETPLSFVLAGNVIRCTIDAVLDTRSDPDLRDITIVDWKTGALPGEHALQSRQLQLALYRLGYAKAYHCNLEDISAVFVYLSDDGTIREIYAPDVPEESIVELISQRTGKL